MALLLQLGFFCVSSCYIHDTGVGSILTLEQLFEKLGRGSLHNNKYQIC